MTVQLDKIKHELSNSKRDSNESKKGSKDEKVEFIWSRSGEWYSVKAKVLGIETTRTFRYEKDNPKSEEEQFYEQALKIKQDVIEKFQWIHKVNTNGGHITFYG